MQRSNATVTAIPKTLVIRFIALRHWRHYGASSSPSSWGVSFTGHLTGYGIDPDVNVAASAHIVGSDAPTSPTKEDEAPIQLYLNWLPPKPSIFRSYRTGNLKYFVPSHNIF
jgi:hypothetical protein